ncbi:MAG TPA: hypothetical protein PLZ15_14605 [Melioribacteraceae bacterium]|nr:hypothetical protein [Melioribacteraceae bacterium]
MSLVPIIYTSLILFFGLLLIVTTISYLSFKARGKSNPVIEAEIKKREIRHPAPIVRRVAIDPSIYNKQVIANNSSRTQNIDSAHSPVILPRDYFQNEQAINKNGGRERRSDNTINYEERNRIYKQPKTYLQRSRIEVMNENEKYRTNEGDRVYKKTSRAKYLNDLSQFNILSFYSDNNIDNDFVAVTANAASSSHIA